MSTKPIRLTNIKPIDPWRLTPIKQKPISSYLKRKRVKTPYKRTSLKLIELQGSTFSAPATTLPNKLESIFDGFMLGDYGVRQWNAQPNPPKVYVGGNRIHHGLAGLVIAWGGLLFDNKPAIGLGTRLMIDDLLDAPDWLNFNK
jgi:hypothetical protein